jgi:hypothetical protein
MGAMATQLLMAQVEGARQAAQIPLLTGKTFVVSQVSTAGQGLGLGNTLFLTPEGGGNLIALKLEGANQAAMLSGLVGQSVTIGSSPLGAPRMLVIQPKAAAAAKAATAAKSAAVAKTAAVAKGAGAAGAATAAQGSAGSGVMLQLEGVRQAGQIPLLSGQSFTVISPPIVGNNAQNWLFLKANGTGKVVAFKLQNGAGAQALVGKTVTIGASPVTAGNNAQWLVLQKGTIAAKGATAGGVTAGGMDGMRLVALKTGPGAAPATSTAADAATTATVTKISTAGKVSAAGAASTGKAAAAAGVAKTATAGTIWKGTGMSLGLGLGLGSWGPVLLLSLMSYGGVGLYLYLKRRSRI